MYPRFINVFYIVTLLLVNLRIHYMKSRNVLHMLLLITVILFIPVFT